MTTITRIGPDNRPIGDTHVCVFSRTYSTGKSDAGLQEKGEKYSHQASDIRMMSLRDFLGLGSSYKRELDAIRETRDKAERTRMKRASLPAGCLSCIISTRAASVPKEQKIKFYNSIIVLDFDNLKDPEHAKLDLSAWPCFWFLGLSASGRGLYGIVPVETADWQEHKKYFEALASEMKRLGYEVDAGCKDETRLRYVSYDPNPYLNDSCDVFSIPDNPSEAEDVEDSEEDSSHFEISDNERMRLYVEEWERKRISLDSYADWMAIGLALSHEGENGLAAFKRGVAFL